MNFAHTTVCLSLSCVQLLVTPWTIAHQAPLPMGFSRQEYWSGLPGPPPGDLPDPGIKPMSHVSCSGRRVLYHWCHPQALSKRVLPLLTGSRSVDCWLSCIPHLPILLFALHSPASPIFPPPMFSLPTSALCAHLCVCEGAGICPHHCLLNLSDLSCLCTAQLRADWSISSQTSLQGIDIL